MNGHPADKRVLALRIKVSASVHGARLHDMLIYEVNDIGDDRDDEVSQGSF